MSSFGDTTKDLSVYCEWELKDEHGADLDVAARTKKFEEWLSRMMVRHLKWVKDTDAGADTWVKSVVHPNGLTSVHEFVTACNAEVVARSTWETTWTSKKLQLRDNGILNDLRL